eukprot:895838-Pelagomonas_calceolata.AAC.1
MRVKVLIHLRLLNVKQSARERHLGRHSQARYLVELFEREERRGLHKPFRGPCILGTPEFQLQQERLLIKSAILLPSFQTLIFVIPFLASFHILTGSENWFRYFMLDEIVSPAADQLDSWAVGQPLITLVRKGKERK